MSAWRFNCWTGNHTLDVTDNLRIVRMAGGGLYAAEFWGDYSLAYPVRGRWRKTLSEARRDAGRLAACEAGQ